VTGNKRTASGSVPKVTQAAPKVVLAAPTPRRASLPRAAKNTPSPTASPSPTATPRGRPPRQGMALTMRVTDPSPTPRPRRTMPTAARAIGAPKEGGSTAQPGGTLEGAAHPQQEAPGLVSAIQQAMAPFMKRLEALERRAMPPPPAPAPAPAPTRGVERNLRGGPDTQPPQHTPDQAGGRWHPERPGSAVESEYTPATHNGRARRGKGRPNLEVGPSHQPPTQHIIATPASYAGAATAAADKQQPALTRQTGSLPLITEVTVLRSGGFHDSQHEINIRARAADAIVREVRLSMTKAVANPIPLKAGRWSVHPRSKGNFVYSFDGNIPFLLLLSYEKILLAPFHGSGQLCPSLGWTRFLVHGVPTTDNEGVIFDPEALLKEVRTLPGLRKTFFAMQPRWLKQIGQLNGPYSSVTFAISDPDGSAAQILFKGRTALFGKEVSVQKWIDKPALVQCARCHILGHNKTSKACQWGKDSVRCHFCGGAHKSEEHDQKCPRKHTVAGVCDCTHFKCLNCNGAGHHCREPRCPARERYRPRSARKRSKGKGKAADTAEQTPEAPEGEIEADQDEELEYLPLHPQPPPGPSRRTQLESPERPGASRPSVGIRPMEIDGPAASQHSPSRPQGSAATGPLA
jgi:hypothetical protein